VHSIRFWTLRRGNRNPLYWREIRWVRGWHVYIAAPTPIVFRVYYCKWPRALRSEQMAEVTLLPKNREEARKVFDAILDPSSPGRQPRTRRCRSDRQGRADRADCRHGSRYPRVYAGWQTAGSQCGGYYLGASDELIPIDYAREMEARAASRAPDSD